MSALVGALWNALCLLLSSEGARGKQCSPGPSRHHKGDFLRAVSESHPKWESQVVYRFSLLRFPRGIVFSRVQLHLLFVALRNLLIFVRLDSGLPHVLDYILGNTNMTEKREELSTRSENRNERKEVTHMQQKRANKTVKNEAITQRRTPTQNGQAHNRHIAETFDVCAHVCHPCKIHM